MFIFTYEYIYIYFLHFIERTCIHSYLWEEKVSWDEFIPRLASSVLPSQDFLWIFPGHGRRVHFLNAAERMERLLTASETFKRDPHGTTAPGPLFHVKNMDMSTV